MDERIKISREPEGQEDIDRYLDKVLQELEALPEYAEDWDPIDPTDEQDAYASEWASVAYGRMDRLEESYRLGFMSPGQSERYVCLKSLFRKRLDLIRCYSLDEPRVPLDR